MKSISKKLSLIIPIYGVEKYIQKCFDSIYNQCIKEEQFEVIAVNDGTIDNSMAIVSKYLNHPNLRIINQANQGLSVARNVGLSASTGDYVWFVDSDDWLLQNSFEIIFREINQNPSIEVFASVLELVYEGSGFHKKEYEPNLQVRTGCDYLFNNHDSNCGAVQRYIFKRSFLEEYHLEFLPGVYHEDAEFAYRMLYFCRNLKIIDTPIYGYFQRMTGSIMSCRKPKMNYDLLLIYNRLKEFAAENVEPKYYWRFMYRINGCLRSSIAFNRHSIFTKGFNNFYIENKRFIKSESWEICKHPFEIGLSRWLIVLQYVLAPRLEFQIKAIIRDLLKK